MNLTHRRTVLLLTFLLLNFVILLSGCATNQINENNTVNNDPIEPINRKLYTFNESLDKYLMKPIARNYVNFTPRPLRTGVTNFFDNMAYMNVALNSLLQGKLDHGLSDIFRFIFNSTIGIGGLFDIATGMGLEEHNEDLGQTFAVWGSGQGAYLNLPLYGPNTVRDAPNLATSILLNPTTYISSTALWPVSALNLINTRANLLEAANIRDEAAIDPYSFTREAYIQQREYLIHDGSPPAEDYNLFFYEQSADEPVLIIE